MRRSVYALFVRVPPLAFALMLLLSHAALVPSLYAYPRAPVSTEMEVALPRFVQVLLAAGDRFLAADLAVFRALVASTETMQESNYQVLARVQSDASWFNPAHEDNYYIAAAILPWYGQLDAAQLVLSRANEARLHDWQPAFYYAFNEFHFRKDAVAGAEWLRIAAAHATDELERLQLQQMAANWLGRGQDKSLSVRLLRVMAKETQHRSFANFLEKRAQRLENIGQIEAAVSRFSSVHGRLPRDLRELEQALILQHLPADPFGMSYRIDSGGRLVIEARADRQESLR